MLPYANILLRPLAHGAVGWWDEILNMVPIVFGAGLMIYLYMGARKRRALEAQQHAAAAPPSTQSAPEPEEQVTPHERS